VIDPPAVLTAGRRFLRGTLTHALLQHLPSLARQERPRAGARYLEIVAPELPQLVRESILAETLAVLEHPEFAPLFGEGSQAEVPITAEIVAPDARGFTVRVTGQIDRLLVTDDAVSIVDFKTNRPPPEEQANVPESYLLQLAAYRAVLQRIYPGRRVAAYLLWTDGARLMPLSDAALDAAERSLFMTKP
jgi:ATP-dependent helicase/nuclease subunit A